MSDARYTFPRRMRLTLARQYLAVRTRGVRRHAGPLTFTALRNGLEHHRLGLSISRRVGNAVRRNAVKRMLRESFRLLQHDLGAEGGRGMDVVVAARPHDDAALADYQAWLREAVTRLQQALPANNEGREQPGPGKI